MNVISFDLAGDFALFKKNDANDMVYISYNFIHKPVLLGILGAIIGIPGYSKNKPGNHPEYYNIFKNIKIAVMPHYHKPLKKVITGFNNASGLASKNTGNAGQTWQIKEQVLVGEPEIRYTIFLLDDGIIPNELKSRLVKRESEYPLYFGKNEFFAYFDIVKEYNAIEVFEGISCFNSLIRLGESNNDQERDIVFQETTFENFNPFDIGKNDGYTIYEYLPYDFDENGFYRKALFVYTERKMVIRKRSDFFTLTDKAGGEPLNVQFI